MGKTNPLNENDLTEFVKASKSMQLGENSWFVDIGSINTDTWDLTVSNPNKIEEIDNRTPQQILDEIEQLDIQASKAFKKIRELF